MYRESCESIKRERDDLRDELQSERDERRRQYQRKREQAEQRRAEIHRQANPSNRLYSGEVTDFQEATKLHVAACRQEITQPEPDDEDEMRRTIESCNRTMTESIRQAHRALAIYDKMTSETEKRIADALRAESLDDWASCLESGDYSRMAIWEQNHETLRHLVQRLEGLQGRLDARATVASQ